MKSLLLLLLPLILPTTIYCQQIVLLTNLHDSVKETSGLIYLNNNFITHSDSGGEPALYEIDSISGNVTRKVILNNASNVDWEAICTDNFYIYIGDIGNNGGVRNDLRIYRLPISDYLTTPNDTVSADIINFSYADQTNFAPAPYSTNFDAEALISIHDSLYIFTKNWGNFRTNIYRLPKVPGTYQAIKIDSINAQGLIAGATYDQSDNSIGLIGYNFTSSLFIRISQFTNSQFSNGTVVRNLIQVPASIQTEGITTLRPREYYLTAEEHTSGNSSLYRLNINQPLGIESITNNESFFFPNPTDNSIHIKSDDVKSIEIYNLSGVLIKTSKTNNIDTKDIKSGTYLVLIKYKAGLDQIQKLVIL